MTSYSKKKNIKQFDKVVEYILTRSIDEIDTLSVKSIARKLNINRIQLWRSFRKESKVSIEAYILRIKLHEAATLLRNNRHLTVKKISEKIGYCRCDYFIRIFKQYFGTTPGRYREFKMRR